MRPSHHPTIDVHLDAEAWTKTRDDDVRHGLTSTPRSMSPVWFYDDHGSDLFDQITRLPEYYQTRAERRLLQQHAGLLAATGAETLVELGSGTSDKTVEILDAMEAAGSLRTYVPFDVSEATVRAAIDRLHERYPSLGFHGVIGDFNHHLGCLPRTGKRLVAFLGGTIGNFRPEERARFFGDLARNLDDGDLLLVGIDLLKDPEKIVAAYDDAAGVTAAFNLNALQVMNTDLGADFDPSSFEHVARWNAEDRWIEMRLRALRGMQVSIPAIGLEIDIAEGEELLTEVSAKFAPADFVAELAAAGFATEQVLVSEGDEFGLVLARPCA